MKSCLTELKAAIKSRHKDAIFDAALKVGDQGCRQAIPLLRKLLRSHGSERALNGAALALRELEADEAIPDLIHRIEDPILRKRRGTLVYALQTLEWYSKYAHSVARLLVDENYEVRTMAFQALETASDDMSADQKAGMLAALAVSIAGRLPLPDDVKETIEAALPLLVTAKAMEVAEPALVNS